MGESTRRSFMKQAATAWWPHSTRRRVPTIASEAIGGWRGTNADEAQLPRSKFSGCAILIRAIARAAQELSLASAQRPAICDGTDDED